AWCRARLFLLEPPRTARWAVRIASPDSRSARIKPRDVWLNEMPHPCLADGVFLIIAVPKGGTPHNPAFLQVQPERPKVAADVRNRNISGGSATLRRQTCGAEEQAETARDAQSRGWPQICG
ncbi:MAG: hypothetical protein QMB46_00655, partial [Bifidobacterium adolescentis]